jgi:hypothetical protein
VGAEHPQIARLADRESLRPRRIHLIGRGVLLEVGLQPVDFDDAALHFLVRPKQPLSVIINNNSEKASNTKLPRVLVGVVVGCIGVLFSVLLNFFFSRDRLLKRRVRDRE